MPNQLEQRIAQFTAWRENLVKSIDEFRAWQDAYGQADIELTLRIYDLVEGLRNGSLRPVIAEELPLAEAARSHEAVMAPGHHGKIVLVP